MKRKVVLFILIFLLFSCGESTVQDLQNVSGILKDGLRYLSIPEGGEDLKYTVYRGDYIVLELPESSQRPFSVPGLGIDVALPKPVNEKPYVKIKKSGEFPFSLGEVTGVLTVKEVVSANYNEVTAEEALALIDATDPLILDVRTPGEYQSIRIEGAKLLPVQLLAGNVDKLHEDKDEVILLYCQSGNRSTVAAQILLKAGFSRLYNLRYGIGNWITEGQPTVR